MKKTKADLIMEELKELLNGRLGRLESKIDQINESVSDLRERVAKMEGKVMGNPSFSARDSTILAGVGLGVLALLGFLGKFVH